MAAIAHKYCLNGVLLKYVVYLCLHNLACNKCRLMRTHMRRSTSVAHLWLPGGSGYFPPDLLIFFRDDQAVPVHVEEIEDDTEGVFHPQPQMLLTKLLLISEGFSMNESILTVRLRKEFACWSTRNRSEYHILLPRRSFEDWTHRTWNWNENQTRNSITPPSLCARLFEHVSLGLVIDIATSHSPLCNPERGLPTDTLLLQPLIVVWNQDILNYPRNYPKIQRLFMGR